MIRQPIVAVLGHVDHGKTTLLDKIRGTTVASKEAGKITQHVGASEINSQTIKNVCTKMLEQNKIELKIPGLLFIDTPGHEAFTSLRDRGGSIADIALLIIDIRQGIQPQTIESLNILKSYKTPFIIVANKIDNLQSWKSQKTYCVSESLKYDDNDSEEFNNKIYEIMGQLAEHGFDSDRFDRITDFTKNIMIIPASAKTGEGMAEILVYLTGLSQKFLEQNLKIEVSGPGRGSILEVKEEKGLGTTIDVIIYDGTLNKGDTIVFGTLTEPRITKVRAIMKPKLSGEKGDAKYRYVDEIHAASGAKIFAPNLEGAISGSPIIVANQTQEKAIQIIKDQLKDIIFGSDENGLIIKADTLGSAEALIKMFKEKEIPIRAVNIGNINKKDILDTQVVKENNKYYGAILGFNVKINDDAKETATKLAIPVMISNVIYNLIDQYIEWKDTERRRDMEEMIKSIPWPARIRILPDHVFRDCKPCIVGVEVLTGRIRAGTRLITDTGEILGIMKHIQAKNESVSEAVKGMKVAISIVGPSFCKQMEEGMKLYPYINKTMADTFKKRFEDELNDEEKELLTQIVHKTKKIVE